MASIYEQLMSGRAGITPRLGALGDNTTEILREDPTFDAVKQIFPKSILILKDEL